MLCFFFLVLVQVIYITCMSYIENCTYISAMINNLLGIRQLIGNMTMHINTKTLGHLRLEDMDQVPEFQLCNTEPVCSSLATS